MDEKDMLLKTIEGLNASVASLSAINKKQADQNEKQQERIRELTAQVAWLNRRLFGRKAEKLPVYTPTCRISLRTNLPACCKRPKKSVTKQWRR